MMPPIFSQKYQNIDKYAKNFFEILVLTALTVGLIWTILELTPKSAPLSLTNNYTAVQIHTYIFFLSGLFK